ncbi:hypothetical protein L208DRAFT_1359766, partial [Tricholoma matsutake]
MIVSIFYIEFIQSGSKNSNPLQGTSVYHVPLDLPPRPLEIFGREKDLERIVAVIQENKHPVIHGLGGIGKTAIARNVMQTFDNGHFKRQEFIRCHTLCTAQDLIAQLLRLVKTDENGITAIIKVLKTNPTFLILDNFETLWDRDGENVAVLLSQIADISPSTILITTRTSTLPDHSDLVDYFTSILLRPIDQVASKKLFIKKAPRHADDADLGKLLELLDGYPLAISLVATRAAKMSSTLSSVINLWKKEVASYDSTLRSKEQSLEISLKLSIHGPIMESAPSALGLLSFIAHFP